MKDSTFYVRNWRPNRLVFKYAGLKYILERRGDRQDTVALPVDAQSDPTIARWLKSSMLEDIQRDDYIELASRVTEGPFGELRSRAKDVDIPIEDRTSDQPTTIRTELLDNQEWRRKHLSPNLEFRDKPKSSADEVADIKAAREKASELEKKTKEKEAKV